jgi:hypothetical protein
VRGARNYDNRRYAATDVRAAYGLKWYSQVRQ